MTHTEVIHAYRHLFRAGLRAVCYSYPARIGVRNLLRRSFRAGDAQLDERAIKRTLWFLKNAAREVGIEHKVVKNILMVQFWRDSVAKYEKPSWHQIVSDTANKKPTVVADSTYVHYERTIDMLNKTMGLCLPSR